jgi:hypothetical protein
MGACNTANASSQVLNAPTDNNTNTIIESVSMASATAVRGCNRLYQVKDSNSGACTVTYTLNLAAQDMHIAIFEVSGLDITAAAVTTGTGDQAASTTYSVSTSGSANAGDLVISWHYANSTGANAFVLASGYDNASKILNQNGTGVDSSFCQVKLSASSGVQTASGSMTSDTCTSVIATFKTAVGGGTPLVAVDFSPGAGGTALPQPTAVAW